MTKRQQEQERQKAAASRVMCLRLDARANVVKAAQIVASDVDLMQRLGYEVKALEIRGHFLRRSERER